MPGPYYFCYIDAPEDFDPDVHNVEDEAIILATVKQDEGSFASLEIDVINPREGLLAPGRKPWCWFSWDNGSEIVALFTGRLVAIAVQMDGETVRLQFIAKPADYETLKSDLADAMKVLPFWDPVWIATDLSDADAVLKTYGALWHIDRTTLELGISDELVPEDGTITLTAEDVIYSSVGQTYSQKPKLKGKFQGTLTYSQTGKGTVDLTERIVSLFGADKSIYKNKGSGVISTLTGDGLKSDWPTGGTSLDGGWTVNVDTSIEEASTTNFPPYTYDVPYQGLSPSWDSSTESTQFAWLDSLTDYTVKFPVAALKQATKFDWAADRKRTEILEFEMLADIQPLESDTSDTESTATLTISASDTVTEPDPDTGVMPIVDKRRKAYLPTARGAISVWYPLLLMRAELRRGARCIEHKLRTPWAIGITATLRKSILFPDGRLPGGAVSGKITSYSFTASATEGFYCEFTLGSAIGYGGTVSAASGTGTYAEDGYMEDGYQVATGAQESVPGLETELVYQSLTDAVAFPIDDDGVDLLTMDEITAVETLTLTGGLGTQVTAVTAAFDPITALKDYPSVVCLQLKPVAGQDPFETTFNIAVEPLPIPQGINLEASA
jgi:hypothetical protein